MAAVFSVTITGCSSQADSDPPSPSSTDLSPTSSTSNDTERTGNQEAEFGDKIMVADEAGNKELTLTVTDIDTQKTCPGEHGETHHPMQADRFLVADLTITTTDQIDRDLGYYWSPSDDVAVVSSEGVVDTNTNSIWQAANCYPDSQLPSDGLRPSMTYETRMVVETDASSGRLVIHPAGPRDGFVWDF